MVTLTQFKQFGNIIDANEVAVTDGSTRLIIEGDAGTIEAEYQPKEVHTQDYSGDIIRISSLSGRHARAQTTAHANADAFTIKQTVDDHNLLTKLEYNNEFRNIEISVYGPPANHTPKGPTLADDSLSDKNYIFQTQVKTTND